jgi:hypothetical protein
MSCLNYYAQAVCASDESNSCLCGNPDFAEGVAQCAGGACGVTDGGQTIDSIWETMSSNCNATGTPMSVTLQDFESGAGIDSATTGGATSSGSSSGGYVDSSGSGSVPAVPADIPEATPAESAPLESVASDPIQ